MAKVKLSGQCEDCRELPVMTRPGRKFTRCEDCRRENILGRMKERKVKRVLKDSVHKLIQYNEGNGWRAGYLIQLHDRAAQVQPIGAMSGICPEIIVVRLSDVLPEKLQSLSCPTVEDYYKMTAKKRVPVLVAQTVKLAAAVTAAKPIGIVPVVLPLEVSCDGEDMGIVEARAAARFPEPVQETKPGPRDVELAAQAAYSKELTATKRSTHAPFDAAEAIRMYQLVPRPKMSEIVEAVKGTRATGATGNLVRDALRKAGIYEEPVK